MPEYRGREIVVQGGPEPARKPPPPETPVPQEPEAESGAQRLIRGVILLVGTTALLAGIAGGVSGAIAAPQIALMVAAIGSAMAVAVLLPMVAAKPKPVLLVILDEGEPVRLDSRYQPGPRTMAVVGLVVVVGAFGWYARRTIHASAAPLTAQMDEYDTYPRRNFNTALVEPTFNSRLSRYSTYTGRIIDEDRLDDGRRFTTAASISRRNTFYGPTTLDYQTFAVEFDLQARPSHVPVKVEAIRVIVDAYEPLPLYERPVGGGPVTDIAPFYLYYAVLPRPTDGTSRKVLAEIVAVEDAPPGGACARLCLRRPDGGDVLLTADEPTAFLVKVEPRRPGFYGFDVEVLLSDGLELQRVTVSSFTNVLFY